MRHREIIPTDDHQTGQADRRVAAQVDLRQGHWAGTVLAHWTGHYTIDISRPSFDEYRCTRATSCRTTWLSQDEPTGVKWKVMCWFLSSHSCTSGVAWVDRLPSTTWIDRPACGLTAFFRKSRKSCPFRVCLHSPKTSPVCTLSAAKRLVVPCRT